MATETGNAAAEIMYHYAVHDAHGYTQGTGRTGTGTETLDYKGVTLSFPGGDGDCSDGNLRAWRAVGRAVGNDFTSYASYTGNIKPALLATGLWEVWPLSRRGEICPGDLYLKPGRHVAMAINKTQLAEFYINEKGTITGGKPGDQTGWECRIANYYNYPWECIMHYKGPDYLAELLEDDMSKEDVQAINSRLDTLNDTFSSKMDELIKLLTPTSPIMPFGGPVYRLINTSTGAHTWTNSLERRDGLVAKGWQLEGERFKLGTCGDPIWCLVHPDNGEVIMTTDIAEAKTLAAAKWLSEGVIGTTGDGPEVHRLYNRGNGYHLFTTDMNEVSANKSAGWTDEGVKFRAV